MISSLTDILKGKPRARRSYKWPSARAKHLVLNPICEVCGGRDSVEVHHIQPFHIHPDLELYPENLMTLCESKKKGVNCHLFFGHLGNFKTINPTAPEDAANWKIKLLKPTP